MDPSAGGNADTAVIDQPDQTAPPASVEAPAAETSGNGEGSTSNIAPAAAPAPEPELDEVEVLRIENARLKREIAAHQDYRRRTDEINASVKEAERHREACKAEYKRAKERHADALEELRAFTSGEVQVRIGFDEKDGGSEAPGQVKAPPRRDFSGVGPGTDHRAVAGTYGAWQFGLTRDALDKADASALRQMEPELGKRKVGAVEVLKRLHVPLEQRVYDDGSGYFNLWPLLEVDEWDGRCAEQYAHSVRDLIDESPDIVARRKAGGEFCGVMVKVGRKRYVVAPDSEVVRVVYPPDGVKGGDGGYVASKLLAAGAEAHAKVLDTPAKMLGDKLAERLAQYCPTSKGHREGLAMALAGDLGVTEADLVAAAKADTFRFDVYLDAANGQSHEVVRLLAEDKPSDAVQRTAFDDDEIDSDDVDDESDDE